MHSIIRLKFYWGDHKIFLNSNVIWKLCCMMYLYIFLDFNKAFDTVDHKILLPKLIFYGIRGVSREWNQIIVIDCITSSSISRGVPHRSVLDPILFLLFVNDLPNSSSLFKFILFADDSTLSTSFAEENALDLH